MSFIIHDLWDGVDYADPTKLRNLISPAFSTLVSRQVFRSKRRKRRDRICPRRIWNPNWHSRIREMPPREMLGVEPGDGVTRYSSGPRALRQRQTTNTHSTLEIRSYIYVQIPGRVISNGICAQHEICHTTSLKVTQHTTNRRMFAKAEPIDEEYEKIMQKQVMPVVSRSASAPVQTFCPV